MILPDLERDELAEIGLLLAQSVAELADGFAANRPGRGAPFHERFLRAARSPCRNPPPRRCGHLPNNLPSTGEIFSMDRAAAVPFAGEGAGIFAR